MKNPVRPSATRAVAKRKKGSAGDPPAAPGERRSKRTAIKNAAIAKELAPAAAIAVLEKSEQAPGEPPAALEVLVAGASPSEVGGKVRVQLMFEDGAVLPVEMSADAGAALSDGLSNELPPTKKSGPQPTARRRQSKSRRKDSST